MSHLCFNGWKESSSCSWRSTGLAAGAPQIGHAAASSASFPAFVTKHSVSRVFSFSRLLDLHLRGNLSARYRRQALQPDASRVTLFKSLKGQDLRDRSATSFSVSERAKSQRHQPFPHSPIRHRKPGSSDCNPERADRRADGALQEP